MSIRTSEIRRKSSRQLFSFEYGFALSSIADEKTHNTILNLESKVFDRTWQRTGARIPELIRRA